MVRFISERTKSTWINNEQKVGCVAFFSYTLSLLGSRWGRNGRRTKRPPATRTQSGGQSIQSRALLQGRARGPGGRRRRRRRRVRCSESRLLSKMRPSVPRNSWPQQNPRNHQPVLNSDQLLSINMYKIKVITLQK